MFCCRAAQFHTFLCWNTTNDSSAANGFDLKLFQIRVFQFVHMKTSIPLLIGSLYSNIKNFVSVCERAMDIIEVNLCKSDEGSFGFSLLGKFAGIPHVIYDVIEDSSAAESEVSEKLQKK
jgi:hypothetical protein